MLLMNLNLNDDLLAVYFVGQLNRSGVVFFF